MKKDKRKIVRYMNLPFCNEPVPVYEDEYEKEIQEKQPKNWGDYDDEEFNRSPYPGFMYLTDGVYVNKEGEMMSV
jgi:hypothetical protein